MPSSDPSEPSDHHPNQTVSSSTSDPQLPPGVNALPRDPNQPIHKRPRVFIHRPDEDPEAEFQARENTSYIEAARTIQPSDLLSVHKTPCFRDAMLPGIVGGAGIGALRFVAGAGIMKSCNWSSVAFVGVSCIMYEVCQRRRAYDKDGIRQAVKVLDEKQKLKDAEEKAKKETQDLGKKGGASIWGTFKFW